MTDRNVAPAPEDQPERPGLFLILVAAVTAAVWIVTFPRLFTVGGDTGTFVSIAERLRVGDRLYVDVWDNKDPLVYWLLALTRSITPYASPLLEVLWLAIACVATHRIASRVGLPASISLLGGWALTPVIVCGTLYQAGMTHLPGTALTLAIVAAAMASRWSLVGISFAVLSLLKLTTCPVAAAFLVPFVWRRATGQQVIFALAGSASIWISALMVLLWRGEARGYVEAQLANVQYANTEVAESNGGVIDHLLNVFPAFLDPGEGSAITILAVIVWILLWCRSVSRDQTPGPLLATLRISTALSLVAVIGVLALTGQRVHHGQVLYASGVVSVVLLLVELKSRCIPGLRLLAAGLGGAYLIGGVLHPYFYVDAARHARERSAAFVDSSGEAADILGEAPTGRYARLGKNDGGAHARGLSAWDLACPRFHQYEFDPPQTYRATLTCLESVDIVIVDPAFQPQLGASGWNSFVARSLDYLDQEFACDATDYGQLCKRLR